MNGDEGLSTRLAELVDQSPPSTVDAALAVRTGRARRTRHRLTMVAAVAAVLAGAGLSLLPEGGGGSARPAGPALPTRSAPPLPQLLGAPLTVPAVPGGRETLTTEADFGWLPEEINELEYFPGGEVSARTLGGDTLRWNLYLKVLPAGQLPDPPRAQADGPVLADAAPVGGGRAYTETVSGGSFGDSVTLYWQVPDGRWVSLAGTYLDLAERDGLLRRIAESVVVGHRAVPLPVVVSGLPESFRRTSVMFTRETVRSLDWWSAELNFVDAGGGPLTITATPDAEEPQGYPRPTDLEPGDTKQTCRVAADSVRVCLSTYALPVDFSAVGGREGLLDRVRALGQDVSGWAAEAVR
ncbi:hypothetical protein [Kitasatospora sp. NPDC088783]|uniref:hypothetical protein n=1 Tax=Kitasatospora sp. NPDC088783 TaxID=3364077 RepID=UPI003820B897